MLVADGSGGGTNWSSLDVSQMWALMQNQDTTGHYKTLMGWRRSYELIMEHLAQMQNYRQNLAEAWPPQKSSASAAYIAQLDDMITQLRATYDAAVANHTAFAGATLSLSLTRTDLKKIYDEYAGNQAKIDEFNAKPKPVQYGKVPVLPPKPPVAAERQEELNNQARLLMSKLSTDLVQAQASLTTPPPFDPHVVAGERKKVIGDGAATATPIPTVAYGDTDLAPGGTGSIPATTNHATGSNAPSLLTGSNAAGAGHLSASAGSASRPPGLVLGGTGLPSGAPAANFLPGQASLPTGGAAPLPNVPGSTVIPPAVSFTPRSPSGTAMLPPGTSMRAPDGRLGPMATPAEPTVGPHAMAPSGVIGGLPGTGLGQPSAARTSRVKVNPVGGVIGGSSAKAGSQSSTNFQPMNTVAGRSGKRQADELVGWDPDNPWETSAGVAPVLLPSPEQLIDPGPAIGLD